MHKIKNAIYIASPIISGWAVCILLLVVLLLFTSCANLKNKTFIANGTAILFDLAGVVQLAAVNGLVVTDPNGDNSNLHMMATENNELIALTGATYIFEVHRINYLTPVWAQFPGFSVYDTYKEKDVSYIAIP